MEAKSRAHGSRRNAAVNSEVESDQLQIRRGRRRVNIPPLIKKTRVRDIKPGNSSSGEITLITCQRNRSGSGLYQRKNVGKGCLFVCLFVKPRPDFPGHRERSEANNRLQEFKNLFKALTVSSKPSWKAPFSQIPADKNPRRRKAVFISLSALQLRDG